MSAASSGQPSPAERYADYRRDRQHPVLRDFAAALRLPARRLPGAGAAERSRTGAACWSRPRPARARRWWGSSPSTWPSRPGRKCFYTTPIKALSNQKYHDLVARLRRRQRRPADRRQHRQRRGADRGDDHRGAPQHAVRRLPHPAGPGLRGDGRGPLPRRPGPRRGVGGGDHPPAGVGDAGVAVGDGLQRRGVRRVAGHGARRDDDDRGGAAPGAALPARDGRPAAARPVRLLRRRRAAGFVKEGAPVNAELLRIARDDWASSRMRDRRSRARGRGSAAARARSATAGASGSPAGRT